MIRVKIFPLLVFAPLLLSGCGDFGSNLVQLPTGEIVNAATDRWGSWERVRVAETQATVELLKTEQARLAAERQKKDGPSYVQVTINDKDAMASFALYRANENMKEAMIIMGKAIEVMAGGGKSPYAGLVQYTPAPQGAFAEAIDSVTGLARTPAATVTAGGYALGNVLRGYRDAAGKTEVSSGGGDINYVETHQSAGNDATSTVTNTGRCDTGNCDDQEVSGLTTLEACLDHPPGGYNQNGTPMATDTESCGSYFDELEQ